MFKLRREQMEAFRPLVRAQVPSRILTDLQKQGVKAERDSANGDVVATDSRGFQTRLGFYPDGLPARLTQPSGATYQFQHDKEGRLATFTSPGGERLEMKRDARGNITELRRPGLLSYGLEYDESDRLLCARYPDGSTTQITYHPEGSLDSTTDRMGAVTKYVRKPDGRLNSIIDPLGRETTYKTDESGRLEAVIFPDGSSQKYTFDARSKLAFFTARDDRVLVQELNDQGQIVAVNWGDTNRTEFDYDETGRLILAKNEVSALAFEFGDKGNSISEISCKGRVECEYDGEGRPARITNSRGDSVTYEYNSDGRISVVRDWDGRENVFNYRPDGTISEIKYGNGLAELQRYSSAGRVEESLTIDRAGRPIIQQAYRYNEDARLLSINSSWGDLRRQGSGRVFNYDINDHLVGEFDIESRRALAWYEYDKKGNLVNDSGAAIEVGAMDEPLRYGRQPLEFDRNGNICRIPGSQGEILCNFSADGTLREAIVGGKTISYEYDALGRRVSKSDGTSIWRYEWYGQQLIGEEYQSSVEAEPLCREYLFLPDGTTPLAFRENGNTYWLQTDARGAVIHAFDTSGSVVWRASYESFGSVLIEVDQVRQPWRLVGQYEDQETGIFYCLARYYSPKIKSFLSRDPSWYFAGATNYSYAQNDPWNKTDPFGAIIQVLIGLGIIAIGAIVGAAIEAATGGDPVAGAVEGGLATAGAVIGALAGPFGIVVGGIIGSGLGAFGGTLAKEAHRGEPLCFECALEAAGLAIALNILLLGLGRIPGVRQLASWVGGRLSAIGSAIWGRIATTEIGASLEAKFGRAISNAYRETFFEAHPTLKGKVVVHHAVEQQTLERYPGVVSEEEIHSLENLRGIPKESNSDLHLSKIRKIWNEFYRKNPNPTKEQLLEQATKIDNQFGHLFDPPIRKAPK